MFARELRYLKDMVFKKYDYYLPKELIALKPASPRDSSRLFVYNIKTDHIFFNRFYNLPHYLPQNSFLVLNNTKVIPARLTLSKENGGKVVCLFLVNEMREDDEGAKVFVDRKVEVGERLQVQGSSFIVHSQNHKVFTLRMEFGRKKLLEILEKWGTMPVPLYLRKTPLKNNDLREKYQTVFADKNVDKLGSIAAPTASLHFTNRLFKKLEQKGINKSYVKLHVGLGTFAPIDEETINKKKLHIEYINVDKHTADLINQNKSAGKKLVAAGTTVVRTLESVVQKNINNYKIKEYFGDTDVFIYPPYRFKIVDSLITNFHLPKSSLMMLVDAFLLWKGAKRSLRNLYSIAIKNKFRFYSFGDAILIL